MNNIIIKILTIFLILVGLTKNINADELKPSDSHQFNFFQECLISTVIKEKKFRTIWYTTFE